MSSAEAIKLPRSLVLHQELNSGNKTMTWSQEIKDIISKEPLTDDDLLDTSTKQLPLSPDYNNLPIVPRQPTKHNQGKGCGPFDLL